MLGDLVFGLGGWLLVSVAAVQFLAVARGLASPGGVTTAGVIVLSASGAVTMLAGGQVLLEILSARFT